CTEQGRGADGFQRPLVPRSRFQPQLTVGSKNSCGFALWYVESLTKLGQAQHSSLPNHGAPPAHTSRDPWHSRFLMRTGSRALPSPCHWVQSSVRQVFPLPFSHIPLNIKRLVHFTRYDVVM